VRTQRQVAKYGSASKKVIRILGQTPEKKKAFSLSTNYISPHPKEKENYSPGPGVGLKATPEPIIS